MLKAAGAALAVGVATLYGCESRSDKITGLNPTQIVTAGGEDQVAFVGHPLPFPLAVIVKNSDGSPASGISVKWDVTAGGGTISGSSGLTDSEGRVWVSWTLGNTVGTQRVTASTPAFNVSPAIFSATGKALPIVVHSNGNAWDTMLADSTSVEVVLTSIWGTGPSNIVAVGRCRRNKLIMTFDGNRWTPTAPCAGIPAGGTFNETYTSVWGSTASDIFAVRQFPQANFNIVGIDRFNGQSWTQSYSRQCSGCTLAVRAVWTGQTGTAIAVGDAGSILRYNGTSWNAEASGTAAHLRAVWGAAAAGPVFAVGDGGTILVNNGSSWTAQASGTAQPLYAVWGISASDVFAVGGAGTILHYN
ncbi:MAG: Ig-like domain-containing protein, partial [Gemmatimonadaceae bacterium]